MTLSHFIDRRKNLMLANIAVAAFSVAMFGVVLAHPAKAEMQSAIGFGCALDAEEVVIFSKDFVDETPPQGEVNGTRYYLGTEGLELVSSGDFTKRIKSDTTANGVLASCILEGLHGRQSPPLRVELRRVGANFNFRGQCGAASDIKLEILADDKVVSRWPSRRDICFSGWDASLSRSVKISRQGIEICNRKGGSERIDVDGGQAERRVSNETCSIQTLASFFDQGHFWNPLTPDIPVSGWPGLDRNGQPIDASTWPAIREGTMQ